MKKYLIQEINNDLFLKDEYGLLIGVDAGSLFLFILENDIFLDKNIIKGNFVIENRKPIFFKEKVSLTDIFFAKENIYENKEIIFSKEVAYKAIGKKENKVIFISDKNEEFLFEEDKIVSFFDVIEMSSKNEEEKEEILYILDKIREMKIDDEIRSLLKDLKELIVKKIEE